MRPRVGRFVAISRTVADLVRTEAFRGDGRDVRRLGPIERIRAAVPEAPGLPDAGGSRLRMGLGARSLTFRALMARAWPDTPLHAGRDGGMNGLVGPDAHGIRLIAEG